MLDLENSTGQRVAGVRPRRLAVLAAAAAVLVVGGGGAAVALAAHGSSGAPGVANGPAGPAGVSVASTPSVPAGSSATPSAGTSGSTGSTPNRSSAHTVHIGPMTLRLPTGWYASSLNTRYGRTEACLVDAQPGARCDLSVVVLNEPAADLSVDSYGALFAREMGCRPVTGPGSTTSYGVRKVGGRSADYRAFTQTCGRDYHYEQWTIPTWPAIQIASTDEQPELAADVHTIVASASFSDADSGRRVIDHGLLAGHSTRDGRTHIALNRTVWVAGGPNNGHDVDDNLTTYDYPLAAGVRIIDSGTLCGDVANPTGTRSCSLATVLTRIDGQQTGQVNLDFDRSGTVVAIRGEYRP
jgi:hypothetical protein